MSMEENSILKNNQEEKSWKTPFIIYADTKSLLEKTHACDKNPENLPQQKSANIKRVAINYSHTIYLIAAEANMSFTKVMTVLKSSMQI